MLQKLKIISALFLLTLSAKTSFAMIQPQKTLLFAQRDTCSLYLDMYYPQAEKSNGICVVYVFGGGFVMGERDSEKNVEYYETLVAEGFTVAAIDYRLGLKGQSHVSPFNPRPAFKAVRIATEDLFSAVEYLTKNSNELNIDTKKIAVVGSSAGAITALQAEYELANRSPLTVNIPQNFRFSAVVSLAGAVFSTKGKPKYNTPPSPTLFMHGTKDKVVVYNKTQILNIGMFGTNALVEIFNKQGFPYQAIRFVDAKHEVAEFPRNYCPQVIANFITQATNGNFDNQLDITVKDRFAKENFKLDLTLNDLYNNNGN